jgi:hypothetical protein
MRKGIVRTHSICAFLALAVSLAGCGGGNRGQDTAVAGGDAGAMEVDALNYEVTPDRYQRWVNVQRALDTISGLREPPTLDPAGFTEADIARAAAYLEADPRARAALARAGVSARDYVLTTLALDQALVASRSTGSGSLGTAPRAAESRGTGSTEAPGGTPARAGGRVAAGEPAATPSGRPRPRFRNLPRTNTEMVERNREDIERVRSGMRFRIVKERVDTVVVERPVEAVARVVPAGTTIELRSDGRVCTNTHKPGDRVTGTVATPVSVSGAGSVAIPAGSSASLSVAGSARGASQMQFLLNSISIGGQTYAVAGTGVASRLDRVRSGSASKDAQKVAGGAVVGAVAGQVLGRDTKSTVIGAAVGAAAGAAAASASARYDTCVPAGAPITVTLRDALNLRV